MSNFEFTKYERVWRDALAHAFVRESTRANPARFADAILDEFQKRFPPDSDLERPRAAFEGRTAGNAESGEKPPRYTPEQLQEFLTQAEVRVPKGVFYRHCKTGQKYVVWGHALCSNYLTPLVHYRTYVSPAVVFSRGLEDFERKFVRVHET